MQLDFEAIFEDSPVPKMVLDDGLCFVAANAAYLEMVGKRREDLIGRYVFDAFPDDPEQIERMLEIFRRTLKGERPAFEEIPFAIEKDGIVTDHWWSLHHAPMKGPSGEIEYLIQYSQDVTDRVRLSHMRDAVMGEMQHRIGNLFTVVGSLARQVARKAEDVPDFVRRFEDQMARFFRLQNDLSNESAEGRDIAAVIHDQLGVYFSQAEDRIKADGPKFLLSPSEAKTVSMAIHELSTNSLKYGAIRTPEARLDVRWTPTADGGVHLVWKEEGLNGAASSKAEGYGTRLLTNILPEQVNGRGIRVMDETSLRYDLTICRS
ncbi:MAG: PAS domain-containing protein [Boseongicola sp.]|nr:PAS domain-containing protein [Boseongicola sp.]